MDWYQDGMLWRVWSRGRTYTTEGVCIDACNVFVGHEFLNGTIWETAQQDQHLSAGPCHNDSTLAVTPADPFYGGTSHRTYADHVVRVNGKRYSYERIGPGPFQVP